MTNNLAKNISLKNRKAFYEYEIIDTFIAGLVLTGTEIKSIRMSQVQMQDAYCYFHNGELWVKALSISKYKEGTHYNHEPTRERKLLLRKLELRKIESKSEERGITIIITKIFINDRGFAKAEIALARGKKLHDKRNSIKEKDVARELQKIKF
ncbi:MAG: SsrA-binding protein SmpB [Cytophagales bacterium]|nr:MAG: SsrA-binding protein SmpB [Cytophagales bacterium]